MPKLTMIGVIPARLGSERLPGKVLRELSGRAMLHHVYDAARGCPLLERLVVATDAEPIYEYCQTRQIPVVMTSAAHRSGTERIGEVMQGTHADVFVNLQADEPLLTARHVELLVEPFFRDPAVQVTTLKTPLDPQAARNPNVVKVVTSREGAALYFSRAAIPYPRDASSLQHYKHLGLYGYRSGALRSYLAMPPSQLERAERLEQLRFLECGVPIYVAETSEDTIGVDTEEDWEAVKRRFAELQRPGC